MTAATDTGKKKIGQEDTAQAEELLEGGKVMSLFDHVKEMRQRVVKSLLAVFVFFCVAMLFSSELFAFLKRPLQNALPGQVNTLHFTGPLDVFMSSIKVSFLAAVVASCPVWLYQFWRFIEPALYKRERRFILPFVFASSGLFILGISFCFYLILPMTLEFLITMGKEVGTPIITITDYVSMLGLMIFGFGFVFETPLILVLLASLDVVDAEMLASARRYVVVAMLVIGALLTPPDPLSQIAMAIPLYLMYEGSIVIIRLMKRKRTT